MQMPNVRRIWHLQPQSALYQKTLNSSIANFFAIQCNSIELHYSSTVKKNNNILWCLFPPKFLSHLPHLFLFSSLSSFSVSPSALSPLFKPKHHPPPNININIRHHPPSLKLHQASHPSPSLKLHTAFLSSLIALYLNQFTLTHLHR